MRVRYTARRKLGLLTAAERLQHEKGMTIRNAAEELLVAHSLIVKWKKQQRAGGGACPIMAMIKSMKKAAHAGPLAAWPVKVQSSKICSAPSLNTVSRGLR
jgi:hypothetical protein